MAKEKRPVVDVEAELAAVEAELAALTGKKPAPRKAPAPPPAPRAEPAPASPAHEAASPAEEKKPRFAFGKRKADEPAAAEPSAPPAEKKSRFAFGRKKDAPAEPAHAPASAPAPVETAPAAPAEEAPRKRGLPSFGRRKDEAPHAQADDVPPLVASFAPTPLPRAAPGPAQAPAIPVTDPAPWRQEADGAWVRAVPGRPTPVVRRILDEEDRVVREEPADAAALREDHEGGHEPAPGEKGDKGLGRLFRRRT